MLSADMIRAVARVIRDSDQIQPSTQRPVASLLRRVATWSELESAAMVSDVEDMERTLRAIGVELPASATDGNAAALPPSAELELRHRILGQALERAIASSPRIAGDSTAEILALSRRQLHRRLACLPIPRSEGDYETLQPPPKELSNL
jgi:hypothetical protein